MKVVTDLSNSFNPVPKNTQKQTKTSEKSGQKRTERRVLHNAKEYTI